MGMHRFTSAGPYRGDLMTHRVQHNPYTHVSLYFYLLVDALARPVDEPPLPKRQFPEVALDPPQLRPDPEELGRLRAKLKAAGRWPEQGPIVLLNPNASDIVPLRKWLPG